ncbi:MAG: S-adenosylmethionine decarboxylase family protein [Candidatus Thorarchaeota archaeon]
MSLGVSVLIDLFGVTEPRPHQADWWERTLEDAVRVAGLTKIGLLAHQFPDQLHSGAGGLGHERPGGATAVALLAESHISVHTWPEFGRVLVDILTCGSNMDVDAVADLIEKSVPHTDMVVTRVPRGGDHE